MASIQGKFQSVDSLSSQDRSLEQAKVSFATAPKGRKSTKKFTKPPLYIDHNKK
jgi:hypothetical protein